VSLRRAGSRTSSLGPSRGGWSARSRSRQGASLALGFGLDGSLDRTKTGTYVMVRDRSAPSHRSDPISAGPRTLRVVPGTLEKSLTDSVDGAKHSPAARPASAPRGCLISRETIERGSAHAVLNRGAGECPTPLR
jgi:hypothetical protein